MNITHTFVIKKLLAIRQKHLKYFIKNDLKIRDCVKIIWVKPSSAHVTNEFLPPKIACDLEEMFWISDENLVKQITFTKRLNAAKNGVTELNDNINVYKFNSEKFKMNLEKFRTIHAVYQEKSQHIITCNAGF